MATTICETEDAYDELRAGRIDLAVVLEPFAAGDEPIDGLVRKHLLDDPYRIMLPAGHRLASARTVELTDLAGDDWVAAVGGNGYCQDDTKEVCRRAGFSPTFVAEAVEFPAAQAYVATGIGVCLVPVLALGAVRDGVVVRKLRREPEPRHVWTLTGGRGAAGPGDPHAARAARGRGVPPRQHRHDAPDPRRCGAGERVSADAGWSGTCASRGLGVLDPGSGCW